VVSLIMAPLDWGAGVKKAQGLKPLGL